jgi:hypothetical protein
MANEDSKPVKVIRSMVYKDKSTLPLIFKLSGWGHIKGENIYIGRHRARCNAPSLGFGPEKCNRKLTTNNLGRYAPRVKQVYCEICADLCMFHDHINYEVVHVIDKKPAEHQIIDAFMHLFGG